MCYRTYTLCYIYIHYVTVYNALIDMLPNTFYYFLSGFDYFCFECLLSASELLCCIKCRRQPELILKLTVTTSAFWMSSWRWWLWWVFRYRRILGHWMASPDHHHWRRCYTCSRCVPRIQQRSLSLLQCSASQDPDWHIGCERFCYFASG